jgi:hypothetical protein
MSADQGRRSRFQLGGIDYGDVVAALVADVPQETPEEREHRRAAEADTELAEMAERRADRVRADEAEQERRNSDPVGTVRAIRLDRLR